MSQQQDTASPRCFPAPTAGQAVSLTPAPTDREAALQAVVRVISSHGDLSLLLRDLTAALRPLAAFDYLNITLYDPAARSSRMYLIEPADPDGAPVPAGLPTHAAESESPTARVWLTQGPVVLQVDREERYIWMADQLRRVGVHTYCALPLTSPRQRLGALGLSSRSPAEYGPEDLAFLARVAQVVAVAVENTLNWQRLEAARAHLTQERDRLRLLLDVSNAVNAHLELGPLLRAIAACVRRVVGHEMAALWLPEPDGRALRAWAVDAGDGPPAADSDLVIPMDPSPSGQAFRTGEPVLLRGEAMGRLTTLAARRLIEQGAGSFCAMPLRYGDRTVGVLSLVGKQADAFGPAVIGLLEQVAAQVAVAVANAQAYRRIHELTRRLAAEKYFLEEEIRTEHNFEEIVGHGSGLRAVLQQVEAVASTDSVVLIQGETGTGKELIARAVHRLSRRRERAFIKLNCAAIPTGLLESELFGHEKGAFTGAIERRLGRFEVADGGTLFLDEVGDIPLELQPKLLRVLQEQEFERLGSTRTVRVNVRLVAATHRDLAGLAAEGQYRPDLYYRLNVFPIRLPPLRDRPDDIPLLVRHFVRKHAQRMHRPVASVSPAALAALRQYAWPGNVRELENLIERAVILSQGPELQLPPDQLLPPAPAPADPVPRAAPATLQAAERALILRTLDECRWVIGGPAGAAARLGLKRTTLLSRLDRLGIRRPSGRR